MSPWCIYIGMSSLSVSRRLLDKSHPARWRRTTPGIWGVYWLPYSVPLEDLERTLIRAFAPDHNTRRDLPRGHWAYESDLEPLLVDVRHPQHMPDAPGVYGLFRCSWRQLLAPAFEEFVSLAYEEAYPR